MKGKSRLTLIPQRKIKRKNTIIAILSILFAISIAVNYSLVRYIQTGKTESALDRIVEKMVTDDTDDTSEDTDTDVYADDEDEVEEQSELLGNEVTDKSEIYDVLYNQIKEGKTTLNISFPTDSMSYDDVHAVYLNILDDHPEFFWLDGGTSGSGISWHYVDSYKIELGTTCDMDKVDAMRDELDSVVGEIVEKAEKYDSDYGKVQYVHDAIVKMCDYDEESFNTLMEEGNDYVDQLTYTAYGCLVNKKSVCNGYACAFKLIMNKLGIECGKISGIGKNDLVTGPHAWNYVCIDGNYVYVDVTWDDPIIRNGASKPKKIRRDYFCISLEEMSKDHFPDEGEYLPQ